MTLCPPYIAYGQQQTTIFLVPHINFNGFSKEEQQYGASATVEFEGEFYSCKTRKLSRFLSTKVIKT